MHRRYSVTVTGSGSVPCCRAINLQHVYVAVTVTVYYYCMYMHVYIYYAPGPGSLFGISP